MALQAERWASGEHVRWFDWISSLPRWSRPPFAPSVSPSPHRRPHPFPNACDSCWLLLVRSVGSNWVWCWGLLCIWRVVCLTSLLPANTSFFFLSRSVASLLFPCPINSPYINPTLPNLALPFFLPFFPPPLSAPCTPVYYISTTMPSFLLNFLSWSPVPPTLLPLFSSHYYHPSFLFSGSLVPTSYYSLSSRPSHLPHSPAGTRQRWGSGWPWTRSPSSALEPNKGTCQWTENGDGWVWMFLLHRLCVSVWQICILLHHGKKIGHKKVAFYLILLNTVDKIIKHNIRVLRVCDFVLDYISLVWEWLLSGVLCTNV